MNNKDWGGAGREPVFNGMNRSSIAIATLLSSAILLSLPARSANCDVIVSAEKAALDAKDIGTAKQLFPQLLPCSSIQRLWAARELALALYLDATKTDVANEDELKSLLEYARPWQALATLGDIASDRHDWTAAAERYQDALRSMRDPSQTPQDVDPAIYQSIRKKAQDANLASRLYVRATSDGLAATEFRGIEIKTVALPIEFVFGKTEFTAEGERAVSDMAEILKQNTGSNIMLIGHTDPIGNDEDNLALSQRRADAVADYLRDHGITAPIRTEGRGRSEPYIPDQPEKYTQEERFQMDRRVELIRR